jgi:hypothetical protein
MSDHEAVQRSERFLSNRRLAWAGLAAVGGCAALCSVPLVAALGVGGGAAATIAGIVRPGTELLIGGGAFASVIAFMAVRLLKRKLTGSEPVACTFDMRDMAAAQAHIDGYRAAFTRLLSAERFPGGFRWVFRAEPGLELQLKNLAEREHDCCRFFHFELTRDEQTIIWQTTADHNATTVLEEYFRLPETLRVEPERGGDISVLKRAFAGSGLVFSADVDCTHSKSSRL